MRHKKMKMNGFEKGGCILGLIYLIFLVAILFGWGNNINNVVSNYPPLKEWQAPQLVCTIGIAFAPIGVVCGYIDGGVQKHPNE